MSIQQQRMHERNPLADPTATTEQYLDPSDDTVKEGVPKESFYNVLLPGTRVREVDPDSRYTCIMKSKDYTKEKSGYPCKPGCQPFNIIL